MNTLHFSGLYQLQSKPQPKQAPQNKNPDLGTIRTIAKAHLMRDLENRWSQENYGRKAIVFFASPSPGEKPYSYYLATDGFQSRNKTATQLLEKIDEYCKTDPSNVNLQNQQDPAGKFILEYKYQKQKPIKKLEILYKKPTDNPYKIAGEKFPRLKGWNIIA